MYLTSIHLRDWKAYIDAEFQIPAPTKKKNVVLVNANNGFGKTTLLEALVLGLFGKYGLPLVGRALLTDSGGDDRLELSYSDFVERAFHAQARAQGRSTASVTLTFESDEGERIKVQRKWYFSGSGKHRADQEGVLIWEGHEEDLVSVPRLQSSDEFVRSYITQKFLPVSLAQFFLFDGEQVQRLAKRDMAAQVRHGIEGILGVPTLRELAADLRGYARERRQRTGNIGDETIDRLAAEIRELETELDEATKELAEITPKLEPLRSRQTQLFNEIGSLGGGTYANLKELLESKESFSRKCEQYRERLRQLLSSDVALALAGPELRASTLKRISEESVREKWETGKNQGDVGFDRFIASLDSTPPEIEPDFTESQRNLLSQRLKNAWRNLWYPPPDNCAPDYVHAYLSEPNRVLVMERLRNLDNLAIATINTLLERIEELEAEMKKISARVGQQSGIDEESARIKKDLQAVTTLLSELEAKQKELTRNCEGLCGRLNPKRKEYAELQKASGAAEPLLRRSAMADRIADMIEKIVEEAFPCHVADLGNAMTTAYLAMAHKKVVKRIAIEPDCTVRLLGNGSRDLREMDASAGESQIFALALIAAIAKLAERSFPIVMDTPLARLDPEHRRNVLRYFTETPTQVIFLSQPAEISPEYLQLVQSRISKSFRLIHDEISDGVGRTKVVEGYSAEDVIQ